MRTILFTQVSLDRKGVGDEQVDHFDFSLTIFVLVDLLGMNPNISGHRPDRDSHRGPKAAALPVAIVRRVGTEDEKQGEDKNHHADQKVTCFEGDPSVQAHDARGPDGEEQNLGKNMLHHRALPGQRGKLTAIVL